MPWAQSHSAEANRPPERSRQRNVGIRSGFGSCRLTPIPDPNRTVPWRLGCSSHLSCGRHSARYRIPLNATLLRRLRKCLRPRNCTKV